MAKGSCLFSCRRAALALLTKWKTFGAMAGFALFLLLRFLASRSRSRRRFGLNLHVRAHAPCVFRCTLTFCAFFCAGTEGTSGGGGRAATNMPFGHATQGRGATAGAGRARGAAAAQPSQPRSTRQQKEKTCVSLNSLPAERRLRFCTDAPSFSSCESCHAKLPSSEVTLSASMLLHVCKKCEDALHDRPPARAEQVRPAARAPANAGLTQSPSPQTPFHSALEKAQRAQPKPKKCAEVRWLHCGFYCESGCLLLRAQG